MGSNCGLPFARAEAPSRSIVIEQCFLRTYMVNFPNGHHDFFATASVGSPGSEVGGRWGHFFSVSCLAPKPRSFWKIAQPRHRCKLGTLAPYQTNLGRLRWIALLIDQWAVDFTVDEVSDEDKIRAG